MRAQFLINYLKRKLYNNNNNIGIAATIYYYTSCAHIYSNNYCIYIYIYKVDVYTRICRVYNIMLYKLIVVPAGRISTARACYPFVGASVVFRRRVRNRWFISVFTGPPALDGYNMMRSLAYIIHVMWRVCVLHDASVSVGVGEGEGWLCRGLKIVNNSCWLTLYITLLYNNNVPFHFQLRWTPPPTKSRCERLWKIVMTIAQWPNKDAL